MRAASKVQGATVVERIGAAAGEVAAELRCKAVAGESDAAVADAAGRRLPGPERKRFGIRESGVGQEPSFDGTGPGTGGGSGAQDALHQVRAADAGFTGRQANPRLSREIKRLGRYDGLIIDDLGYLQQSRDDMEVVFTLLAERYERGSVLMTSNLPFSKWEAIFKDALMTAAAIDRLVHHSVIIELNIPSYRVEHAKKNQQAESQAEGE